MSDNHFAGCPFLYLVKRRMALRDIRRICFTVQTEYLWRVFCIWKNKYDERGKVKVLKNITEESQIHRLEPGNQRKKLFSRFVFMAFMLLTTPVISAVPAFADGNIFSTAKTAMQTVYTDIAGIATVAAVVCTAVCLFLMNFSRSGRTVDESRAWLKRIIICWAALMTLGAIVTYMEGIIPKSTFTA